MPDTDPAKLAAARRAIELVRDGMRLGLGTGSTASIMVRELAARVQREGLNLRCAATSKATAELAGSLGLRVESLNDLGWLDLTIDGADEVDPGLGLIKGGGGAHLREKVVAMAGDRMVVIADPGKVVAQLGKFPLPVEVLAFGFNPTVGLIGRVLANLGYSDKPIRQRMKDGKPQVTDEGNYIVDLELEKITDAAALAAALAAVPGVVEHGLFLGICDLAVVGQPDESTIELHRKGKEATI